MNAAIGLVDAAPEGRPMSSHSPYDQNFGPNPYMDTPQGQGGQNWGSVPPTQPQHRQQMPPQQAPYGGAPHGAPAGHGYSAPAAPYAGAPGYGANTQGGYGAHTAPGYGAPGGHGAPGAYGAPASGPAPYGNPNYTQTPYGVMTPGQAHGTGQAMAIIGLVLGVLSILVALLWSFPSLLLAGGGLSCALGSRKSPTTSKGLMIAALITSGIGFALAVIGALLNLILS